MTHVAPIKSNHVDPLSTLIMQGASLPANVTLNADQAAAADDIFDFILSDEKEHRVSGPGGTGKTTLITAAIRKIVAEYELTCKMLGMVPVERNIYLTATTNKAAEVLSQTTSMHATTIHSHLALRIQDDYKTGDTKLIRTPSWSVLGNQIIIIDEASMINRTLYNHIMEGTDSTCKIIYLGDHCQLAPVKEQLSQVYRTKSNTSYLNTPVRNAGQPALMDLCNRVRDVVEGGKFFDIEPVPGVVDIFDRDEAFNFLNQEFSQETDTVRILAHTNKTVNNYNEYIRNLRQYPKHLIAGETVINNSSFALTPKIQLSAQGEVRIHSVDTSNSVSYSVCGVDIDCYEVNLLVGLFSATIKTFVPFSYNEALKAMKAAARLKDWQSYFWVKNTIPDFRPKDAITVYKSQGSTYDTVFMDLDDISTCTQNNQLSRLLYVGLTRAKSRVVIFGSLPNRVLL